MKRFGPLLLWLLSQPLAAALTVTDDLGHRLELPAPPQRIVSLAPHVTELLFAAGAGAHVIAVGDFSDYPEAARHLPRIGDATRIDLERLLLLEPDLVIAWGSGTPARQLEAVRRLGLPLFLSEPRRLNEIGAQLRALGRIAGDPTVADAAADVYEQRLAALRERYAHAERRSVFYQLALVPLLTVNGEHIISDMLDLCGGDNLFGALPELTPRVSEEAVVMARPQAVVLALYPGEDQTETERFWRRYGLPATTRFIAVPGDYIHRATPRILEGAERVCSGLEQVP